MPIIATVSLCVGCQTAKLPPPPPLPHHAAQFALPEQVFTAPAPAKPISLVWGYPLPLPQDHLIFELYAAAQPTGPFVWFTNASAPPILIAPIAPQQFFILRARDTTTGLVSDWNQ